MAQVGNNVNRVSGSHLIADEDHMGEIIARLQNTEQGNSQVEQSHTYQQQQGGSDRIAVRQNDNRTRQAY